MINQTTIEWTDFTVNFWEGCQKVGPGCDNCYAEARDIRFTGGSHWGPGAPRRLVKGGIAKLRGINKRAALFYEQHGRYPRVFCSSLSDVFDNAVDPDWRRDAFLSMDAVKSTRIQVLTKRVGNVEKMIPKVWKMRGWPSHIGLMITVVNQAEADRDIPKLLDLKAQLGIPWVGLSVEPLLGPINLLITDNLGHDISTLTGIAVDPTDPDGADEYYRTSKLDWVIVGGESGPNARPMHPDWARSIRDQCAAAGTPFLFKQWGEWTDHTHAEPDLCGAKSHHAFRPTGEVVGVGYGNAGALDPDWREHSGAWMCRVGKKAAGRMLDGVTHDGVPT